MLTGKGIFIWRIRECDGGDIAKIVSRCVNAKFSHVLIKIADGIYGYNYIDGVDKAKELADALKAVDIEPWGWQYVFGTDPISEASAATKRMEQIGCVGFVINAEQQYRDLPNNQEVALQYVQRLLFETPIALSSYRYPKLHSNLPWQEFLGVCDLIMPQVYWMQATNSADQLWQCVEEYRTFTDLPIFPTGAAFCEHGWCPTNEEIIAFADEAKRLELPGINFWEFACSRKDGFWQTVKELEYFEPEPVPPVDCCEELQADIHALERWQVEMPTPAFLFEELDKIHANTTEIDTLRQREIEHTREHNADIDKIKEDLEHWCIPENQEDAYKRIDANAVDIVKLKARAVELGVKLDLLEQELLKAHTKIELNRQWLISNKKRYELLYNKFEEIELQNNHTHPAWMQRIGLIR